jgi:hypothetical protein
MIDPFTAFAALKGATEAISQGIKLFGKLTGAEQNAIDAHFRKEEAKRIRDEMREMFLLYGAPGQWERLQKEIATERKRQATLLKQKIAAAKRKKNIILWTIGGILGLGFLAIEFYIITNL